MFRNFAARPRASVALLLALVLAAGCGMIRRNENPSGPAVMAFRNDALDQAAVYLVTTGSEFRRVGTVLPGRTENITFPTEYVNRGSTVNIVARVLAQSYVASTGPVSILPGERYDVRLSNDGRILSFLPARQ